MRVVPLSANLGAEIFDVDLEQITSQEFPIINQLLLDHQLLAFRQQRLSPAGQLALSRRFGPLDIHPLGQYNHSEHPEIFVLSNETVAGKPLGISDGGSYWHSDFAFRPKPAKVTILNAQKIPAAGGNTLFVNMYQTYDELDATFKAQLEDLRAIHRYRPKVHARQGQTTTVAMTAEQQAATPDVIHPIVRKHPETGRKALFAHPGITVEVQGMDLVAGQALLDSIFDHCTQNKYQYTYAWQPGDVVMWDNRCTMHKATTRDAAPIGARTIFRTTTMGEKPF